MREGEGFSLTLVAHFVLRLLGGMQDLVGTFMGKNEILNVKASGIIGCHPSDGCTMLRAGLTLGVGDNQSMGEAEFGQNNGVSLSPEYLRVFDGTARSVIDTSSIPDRDRNVTEAPATRCSVLTLSTDNCLGMGHVEYGEIYDTVLGTEACDIGDCSLSDSCTKMRQS